MPRLPLAPLGLLALLACAPDDEKAPGATDDTAAAEPTPYLPPDEAGPYRAGTWASAHTPAHGVELEVQVWHPAAADATGTPARYGGLLEGAALADVPAACDGPRPVVIFSHGNGGVNFQSIFFTEHLAARGWVVAAPAHTGNTVFDYDEDRTGELTLRRPVDVAATFDWVVAQAAAGGPLEGCVDADAGYAVVGHSFGGFTAMAVASLVLDAAHAGSCRGWLCADAAQYMSEQGITEADLRDPRAWAAVAWTPAAHELLQPTLGAGGPPALVFGGTRDTLTPVEGQVRPIYADYGGEKALGVIEDAGHYGFSDACAMVPTYEDCAAPYLPPEEVQRIAGTVTTAALDAARGIAEAAGWLPPAGEPALEWSAEGG
jgi:predicted dienelactone hydrolase